MSSCRGASLQINTKSPLLGGLDSDGGGLCRPRVEQARWRFDPFRNDVNHLPPASLIYVSGKINVFNHQNICRVLAAGGTRTCRTVRCVDVQQDGADALLTWWVCRQVLQQLGCQVSCKNVRPTALKQQMNKGRVLLLLHYKSRTHRCCTCFNLIHKLCCMYRILTAWIQTATFVSALTNSLIAAGGATTVVFNDDSRGHCWE